MKRLATLWTCSNSGCGSVDEVLTRCACHDDDQNEGKGGLPPCEGPIVQFRGEWSREQKLHFNRGESKELAWFFQ